MTRPERQAVAASRRSIALEMRAAGITWARIGQHLGVSAGRACQIATPTKPRPGNPQSGVRVRETRTVAEWLAARVRAVDECARSHGATP